MAAIWSFRTGAGRWTRDPSTGWDDTVEFSDFHRLLPELDRRGLRGRVERLGVVAHGDSSGLVQLSSAGNLTPSSVASAYYAPIWTDLRLYLTGTAMLAFYSCIAGAGAEGSQLLIAISNRLPGRTIVGFDAYGLMGPAGLPNAPGNMDAQSGGAAGLAMPGLGGTGNRLTPWGFNAKWAYHGRLVRITLFEQMSLDRNRRQTNHCANPACTGHSDPRHRCTGWSGCHWKP